MIKSGIEVSDILVTQSNIRNRYQIPNMIRFVRAGGIFDEDSLGSYAICNALDKVSPLVEIARFEDGVMAIHNGHHRAISIFLGRNNRKIYNDEFFIRDWKYTDYMDVVLPHWITPFDIREEIRLPDLAEWKDEVKEFYKLYGEKRTIEYILNNKEKYVSPRYFYTLGDMISKLNFYYFREISK
jgi:hypothetical protein